MWLTRRALTLHLVVVVVVPLFLGLGWWQLHRALGGNALSWAYTFEWPFFAGYAVFLWWKLVHEPARHPHPVPAGAGAGGDEGGDVDPAVAAARAAEEARVAELARRIEQEQDPELAAYNDYLAALNASGRRKTW
jgi:hypothetical protein